VILRLFNNLIQFFMAMDKASPQNGLAFFLYLD